MPKKSWYKRDMKAYVGIADSDGLRSFLSEGEVPEGFMILEAKAAQRRGWFCFWAAVDEQMAEQISEELASGRRRDAMNLLWVLARELVRYPIEGIPRGPGSSPGFAVHVSRLRGYLSGIEA